MRKILSLVIVVLILTSCQKKVKLELNLTKNETYLQKFTSDIMMTETVNGQPVDINMTVGGTLSFKVLEIHDSIYNMEVKYKNITMKMNMHGQNVEFNSEKKDSNDIFSTIMGYMTGKSFYMDLSKNWKIKEVRGTDSIFAGIFDLFPSIPEDKKQQIKEQMKQSFGEKTFKGNIQMTATTFPDTKIGKGDKWKTSSILESSMTSNIETEFELKDITDSCFVIIGSSKLKTIDKGDGFGFGKLKIKYNMTGTLISEIKIDKKTGWIVTGKVNQEMSGDAKVMDSPEYPGGMNIPMKMKNVMSVTH